jgi:uncharacterized protein (DUF305 family)
MHSNLTRGRIALAALIVLSSLSAYANQPAPNRKTARYEIQFMQSMIDHHAMAVEMAELCLDRAIHEELRTTCESIIATQSQEIQQMQTWLSEWYGITYAPQMSKQEQRDLDRLASLSGAEFEIAFMEMMIEHHQTAIREASQCVEDAYHKPLIRLCEQIIAAQSAEIEQFRTWLCEWYGRCS